MKKWLSVLLALIILSNLTGCETLAKKFRRKNKGPVKMPRMYQLKKYPPKPPAELYKTHYVYWVSWQSELARYLGQNHKKDMLCAEQILSNLQDMQNQLVQEKAAELGKHIDAMAKVKDIIYNEELTQANKDYVRGSLDREERFLRSEFYYNKIKDYMKKYFEEEPLKDEEV